MHGDEKRDALVEHAAGVYVGDTVTDIRSALDASAIAVGVTTGPDDARKLLAAGADVVLDSLDDFPGLVRHHHLSAGQPKCRSDRPGPWPDRPGPVKISPRCVSTRGRARTFFR